MKHNQPAAAPGLDSAFRQVLDEALAPLYEKLKVQERKISLLEKGADEWVPTGKALKIVGFKEPETLINRAKLPGSLIVWKHNEIGNRYLFLRSSLVAFVEANPPRRYRPRRLREAA